MTTLQHQRTMLVTGSMDIARPHGGAMPRADEPYVFSVFQASLSASLLRHEEQLSSGEEQLSTDTEPHRRLSDPGHRRQVPCISPLPDDEFKTIISSGSSTCDDIFETNSTKSSNPYEEGIAPRTKFDDAADNPLRRPSTFALSRFLRPKERSADCRASLPTFPVSMATAHALCRRSRASSLPKLDSLPLIETKEEDEEEEGSESGREDSESGLGSSNDDLASNTKKFRPASHTSFQLRLPDRCQRPQHRRSTVQPHTEEIRRRRHSDCLGLDVIAEEASVWHEQLVTTPRRYSCNSDVLGTACGYEAKDRPEM